MPNHPNLEAGILSTIAELHNADMIAQRYTGRAAASEPMLPRMQTDRRHGQ